MARITLNYDKLRFEEVLEVEERTGRVFYDILDAPRVHDLAVIQHVIGRRDDPTLTWEQVRKMELGDTSIWDKAVANGLGVELGGGDAEDPTEVESRSTGST